MATAPTFLPSRSAPVPRTATGDGPTAMLEWPTGAARAGRRGVLDRAARPADLAGEPGGEEDPGSVGGAERCPNADHSRWQYCQPGGIAFIKLKHISSTPASKFCKIPWTSYKQLSSFALSLRSSTIFTSGLFVSFIADLPLFNYYSSSSAINFYN